MRSFNGSRVGRSIEIDPAIIDRVGHAHLELVPTPKAYHQFASLPANSTVSVTASPVKDLQATLDMAAELLDLGHMVIPHLAARMVSGPAQAAAIATWITDHGVKDVFVIGGDARVPHGPYADASALMRTLLDSNANLSRIGFGGYPDGHATIDVGTLNAALMDKQQLLVEAGVGGWVSSQMCFDAKAVTTWLAKRRAEGLLLPLHLGIPGAIDRTKLLTMGVKLGIGASLRYLSKNRAVVGRLAGPGGYDPMDLLVPMARELDSLDIPALHVFTFNQVADTVAWQRSVGGGATFIDNIAPAGNEIISIETVKG